MSVSYMCIISRVEEVNPEYMMERSFHQFQNYSNIPQVELFLQL